MPQTIQARQSFESAGQGAEIKVMFGIPGEAEQTVWWRIRGPQEALPTKPRDADMALAALIFLAMKRRANLHINGPVSGSLLHRAEQFMQIWSLWAPDKYAPIHISAAEVLPERSPDDSRDAKAVCAFSGGVDAACTALMHRRGLAGRATREILAGVLVQGFDLGLEDTAAFEIAEQTSRNMLNDLEIPLVVLQTNWKTEVCRHWEFEFGAGVFACLKPWENQVGSLLLGSCEDYSRLIVPWGSHPLPTTLLAARSVDLVYDGGHLNRTQKIGILSDWPEGYNQIRVCWEGELTGRNCGVCEKCLRTKMNAIVIGKPLPESLAGRPSPEQVARIGPMNAAQRILYQEILDEAAKAGFDDALLGAVRTAIARTKPPLEERIKKKSRRLARLMRQKLGLAA